MCKWAFHTSILYRSHHKCNISLQQGRKGNKPTEVDKFSEENHGRTEAFVAVSVTGEIPAAAQSYYSVNSKDMFRCAAPLRYKKVVQSIEPEACAVLPSVSSFNYQIRLFRLIHMIGQ